MFRARSSILSSDAPTGRRFWLRGAAGTLALGAGGCGFRPLYGPNGAISAGASATAEPGVAAELAATRVPPIPDRFGQLLRRSLQQRLGTGIGGPSAARWELRIGPGLTAEGIGVQRDGAVTRVRFIGTANWWLVRLGPPTEVVANGFERVIDAFNVPPNQFFASDASRDAMDRRLAETLAEEVVLRVAARFRVQGTASPASPLIAPVDLPPAMPDTLVPRGPALMEPGAGSLGGPPGGLGDPGRLR